MILFLRNVRAIQGKRGEAQKWAVQFTDYINAKSPEITCKVFNPRFGEMNWINWIIEFEDISALDAWQKKMAMDEGYLELNRLAKGLFSQDSIEDKVLASLEIKR